VKGWVEKGRSSRIEKDSESKYYLKREELEMRANR
jgi:hypothetical protein